MTENTENKASFIFTSGSPEPLNAGMISLTTPPQQIESRLHRPVNRPNTFHVWLDEATSIDRVVFERTTRKAEQEIRAAVTANMGLENGKKISRWSPSAEPARRAKWQG